MTAPTRPRGPSVRLKLTLSYAGFLAVAGLALAAVVLIVRPYLPERYLTIIDGSGYRTGRADVLSVSLPLSGIAVASLLVVGLLGGWVIAGRMLRPVIAIGDAARIAADGSLTHRIALPGPDDELRRLADTVDNMLARLERAFEEQRRFTANASHELRTPLAVTRSLLEVAHADPAGPDVEVLLGRLQEMNERSIAILDSLLQLARAERDDLPREPCDLTDVVRAALAAPADADVDVVADLRPAPILGHRALLEQLVGNLVRNARIHNLAGGTVWVDVGPREHGGIALVVANTGEVLPADVVATLTEPFVRASGRTRVAGRPRGIGLGLAVVAAIARAHRAELAISPRPGGGLEVCVTFARPTLVEGRDRTR